MVARLIKNLRPFYSTRFLKFCTVGLSGVVVNLGFLALFADLMKLQTNFASALAIEISIISNFIINEWWTFKDRREGTSSTLSRGARFHLVSLIGALGQWTVFVSLNLLWFFLIFNDFGQMQYHGNAVGFWQKWIVHPILQPPDVGLLKYGSQLIGIGVATFWNFLINYHWTWKTKRTEEASHE